MAIGTTAALLGGGALLGGIAGAKGSKNQSSTSSTSESTSKLDAGQAGGLESLGANITQEQLAGLQQLIGQGPGAGDVTAGTGAQRDLASMLQQYAQGGNIPGAQDIQQAQQFAGGAFAGQQTALQQQFEDQQVQAQRLAAQLNRPVNDPIIQAKLAQQQMRSQQQLEADKTSFATQFAQQLPGQRLDFAQQRAGILSGLASQALANRQNLMSLGSQVQQQGQQFRLATGTQRNTGSQNQTTQGKQGGGIGGAISGAIGGASLASGFGNLMNLGGGGAAAPQVSGGSFPQFAQSMPSPQGGFFNLQQGAQGVGFPSPSRLSQGVGQSSPSFGVTSPNTTNFWSNPFARSGAM